MNISVFIVKDALRNYISDAHILPQAGMVLNTCAAPLNLTQNRGNYP